ncbi:hypothetical protein ACNTMW_27775 [Planosporangium sp. 12N6]|uniref:hypothetical protein n=1 Tax=Planosporangium spinosum TaxID=3402278 RepID=UPI003CF3D02B
MVTRVRVDMDALAEWMRTLDRLPPLAVPLPAEPSRVESSPAECEPAVALHRASTAGLLALAEVVESFDRQTEQLRAAVAVAAAEYALVDGRAATTVAGRVR